MATSNLRDLAIAARKDGALERDRALAAATRALRRDADATFREVTGLGPPGEAWEYVAPGVLAVTRDGIRMEYRGYVDHAGAINCELWVTEVDGVRMPLGTGMVRNLEALGEVIERASAKPPPRPDSLKGDS